MARLIDDEPQKIVGNRYLDKSVDPAVYKWRWKGHGHCSEPAAGNNADKKGVSLDVDITVADSDTAAQIKTKLMAALKTEAGVS